MLKLQSLFSAFALSLLLISACGKPTVESAQARYTSASDKLSALTAKKPESKAAIDAKLAEFKAEYEKANAETDEAKKIEKLSALSSRMESYLAELDPKTDAPKGGAAAPSDKLDGAPPAGEAPSKLDGPAPAPSKLDGAGAAPAPTPTPTPAAGAAPAPAPAGGGMGGL